MRQYHTTHAVKSVTIEPSTMSSVQTHEPMKGARRIIGQPPAKRKRLVESHMKTTGSIGVPTSTQLEKAMKLIARACQPSSG